MKRIIATVIGALSAASAPLAAQELRVDFAGTSHVERETNADRAADGVGWVANAALSSGKFRLFGWVGGSSFTAQSNLEQDFTMQQRAVGAQWIFWRGVAARITTERWVIDPKFAVQDVGLVSAGLAADRPLGRRGRMFAHVAYLPVTKFSGGGHSRVAADVGFGARFDAPIVSLVAEYRLVRMDRIVGTSTVPIELNGGRIGLSRSVCLRAGHCAHP